jgi:hypothetical protein
MLKLRMFKSALVLGLSVSFGCGSSSGGPGTIFFDQGAYVTPASLIPATDAFSHIMVLPNGRVLLNGIGGVSEWNEADGAWQLVPTIENAVISRDEAGTLYASLNGIHRQTGTSQWQYVPGSSEARVSFAGIDHLGLLYGSTTTVAGDARRDFKVLREGAWQPVANPPVVPVNQTPVNALPDERTGRPIVTQTNVTSAPLALANGAFVPLEEAPGLFLDRAQLRLDRVSADKKLAPVNSLTREQTVNGKKYYAIVVTGWEPDGVLYFLVSEELSGRSPAYLMESFARQPSSDLAPRQRSIDWHLVGCNRCRRRPQRRRARDRRRPFPR